MGKICKNKFWAYSRDHLERSDWSLLWPTTVTAKELTSRQKIKPRGKKKKDSRKKEKSHGKRKRLTAKRITSTSRHKK